MTKELVNQIKTQIKATKSKSITDLIQDSVSQLGHALPSHMRPERIARIAMTTLRMNPKLYQCDPMSFLAALFQSAQLGLEPNVEGQAYIIPYKIKDKMTGRFVDVAQFQVGYKGYVELFWRHQSSISLQMEMIHRGDAFSFDIGKNELTHTWDIEADDRGPVIGYYAIAHLTGGGRSIKVISHKEALAHGKRFSKCWDSKKGEFKWGTPWKEHFDEMAMKTVLIKLMKVLPKSIEIQRALEMDETVKTKINSNMFDIPNEDDFSPEDPSRKEMQNDAIEPENLQKREDQ